jgi:uncharacterized protein (TIGR00369 family)
VGGGDATARITAAEFEALATAGVPYVGQLGVRVEHLETGLVRTRLPFSDLLLRPGGTICGPALMGLADVTLYGAVMSLIGRVELAVTTDMAVHFLARPAPADVLAEGRILKLGRRLAVGEVVMRSEGGDPRPVCHVVGTYVIPPWSGG